jgi:hypothetical protein
MKEETMKEFRVKFRKMVISVVTIEAASADDARAIVEDGEWEGDQEVDLVDWETISVVEEP